MKSKECFVRSMDSINRKPFACSSIGRGISALFLFVAGMASLNANPSGAVVVSGSATISGLGTPNVTVTQTSKSLVIDWNAFSIGKGEVTTFIQPTATSTVLNRVTGGGVSKIEGAQAANGHAYIINGNGISIGTDAAVKSAGFTASTLDISNSDFLANKLRFAGASTNGVRNLGSITAVGQDIYLIGRTVDNEAYLTAASGIVGMAAGKSVLIKSSGSQHVFVAPSSTASATSSDTAVINNGNIAATAAELRSADGKTYALAINNSGNIRATTLQNKGGNVYLTSDSGTIVNAGMIDASATAANGASGQITLKSSGTVVNHGRILGHGGQGGIGGTVDLSGGSLDFKGGVDLTTPGGTTGNLLLDPQSINIIANPNANGTISMVGTTTTYMPAPGFIGSQLYTQTLIAQLAIANVIVDGVENVTVTDAVTWGNTTASTAGTETGNTLTLETTVRGGTIVINNALTGHVVPIMPAMGPTPPASTLPKCKLVINAFDNGFVTTGPNGAIDVDNFTLENGIWQQIVSPLAPTAKDPGFMTALPGFNVTNDFQLQNTCTFERFAGGNGLLRTVRTPNNSPYQIVDIFGVQGIGSPSDTLLAANFILDNNINIVPDPIVVGQLDVGNNTINWNGGDGTHGGAGWVPIGEGGKTVKPFSGSFNGNGFYIAGYYLYRPADNLCGLFGEVSGTIESVGVDVLNSEGLGIGGILVGRLLPGGAVVSDVVTGGAFGNEPPTPGTPSSGTTANQSDLPNSALGVSEAGGGLVGEVMKGGLAIDCDSFVGFQLLGGGTSGGLIGDAGLVGVNYGMITNSFSFSSGTTAVNVTASGLPKPTQETDSIALGGLVGTNFGIINGGAASGDNVTAIGGVAGEASILSGNGNFYIGGFVGVNYGTINGKATVKVSGKSVTETYQAFTTNDVTGPGNPANPTAGGGTVDGGTGSYYVGGFAGANYGVITNAYSAPTITGFTDNRNNPLQTGGVVTANGSVNTGALGNYAVGGFAGGNFGSIIHSGTEDTVISNGSVTGVGDTTRTVAGKTITGPEVVSFGIPLSLDSILVGGFVGINCPNGSNGLISGCFSDTVDAAIQFTLDPTIPFTPTAAAPGDTFTLSSAAANNNPLVSSTGLITGGTGFIIVGGFAGGNFFDISTSYAKGNVVVTGTTTQSNSFYTAGFVGVTSNAIKNAFARGDVISQTTSGSPLDETGIVGGFAAEIYGGSLTDTYSLGSVAGGTTRGGLVGVAKNGRSIGSFWDTLNNGGLFGYSAGGTSEPDASLMITETTYATSVYGMARWNFKTVWVAPPVNPDYPTLINVP